MHLMKHYWILNSCLFQGDNSFGGRIRNSTTTVSLWRSEEHNLFTNGVVKLTEGRHITEKIRGKQLFVKIWLIKWLRDRRYAEKRGLWMGAA